MTEEQAEWVIWLLGGILFMLVLISGDVGSLKKGSAKK